jgi:hypothetical protein
MEASFGFHDFIHHFKSLLKNVIEDLVDVLRVAWSDVRGEAFKDSAECVVVLLELHIHPFRSSILSKSSLLIEFLNEMSFFHCFEL